MGLKLTFYEFPHPRSLGFTDRVDIPLESFRFFDDSDLSLNDSSGRPSSLLIASLHSLFFNPLNWSLFSGEHLSVSGPIILTQLARCNSSDRRLCNCFPHGQRISHSTSRVTCQLWLFS